MDSARNSPRSLALWKWPAAAALALLLILFIFGHIWTAGTVWNNVTGARFSPWTNYVSDYAYRSPVWSMFVSCMYGLAALLGALSLVIALGASRRRVLAWLCSSLLAYAALKLCEVAIYPVKPPEITAEQIQSRMDKTSWNRLSEELHRIGTRITGGQVSSPASVQEAINGFQSNANHLLGITPAMMTIFAAMVLCPFLDPARWRSPLKVTLLIAALLLTLAATPSLRLFGQNLGLGQRVGFTGVYLWLWLAWLVTFGTQRRENAPTEYRMD
jgi:hypothetical protein